MKHQMDEKSIQALVTYRLKRAGEALREADILIKNGCYNTAVNRLYYACYYALIALLVKNHVVTQTHDGVKQMFGLHFIATGKIDRKYARFYSQLFNDRISGDYDDFLLFDEETLSELRPMAVEFISVIESSIRNAADC